MNGAPCGVWGGEADSFATLRNDSQKSTSKSQYRGLSTAPRKERAAPVEMTQVGEEKDARRGASLGAADGGFYGAVRFVGGDEDVVGVFLAEAS